MFCVAVCVCSLPHPLTHAPSWCRSLQDNGLDDSAKQQLQKAAGGRVTWRRDDNFDRLPAVGVRHERARDRRQRHYMIYALGAASALVAGVLLRHRLGR